MIEKVWRNSQVSGRWLYPGYPGGELVNANKPRRLWENREIFTGLVYGVIVVTGPTKTLVPAAVMGLVPRDRGAESELFRRFIRTFASFYNLREPVKSYVAAEITFTTWRDLFYLPRRFLKSSM